MAKKSFEGNMPEMFISGQERENTQKVSRENVPKGYKLNPLYIETKTRRTQLLLQPSLYEKLKAAAEANGDSFNNYVHTLLERAMED